MGIPKNKNKILQVDIHGNVVKTWESVRKAAESNFRYNRTHIGYCLRHIKTIYRGFLWVYENEQYLIPEKIKSLNTGVDALFLDGEEWRDIKGFEGWYQVSNFGRIKSLNRPFKPGDKILHPTLKDDGYMKVSLLGGRSKGKNMLIHRLVAEAFLPNPDNLPIINHKDENKSNNHVENLEWCTYRYNTMYSPSIGCTLNRNDMSKPILQFSLDGDFIKEYPSVAEAARQLGVSATSISHACHGKVKQSHGFKWTYAVQKIQDRLSEDDIDSITRLLSAMSQNTCKIIAPMIGKLETTIYRIFGKEMFEQ